MTKAGAYTGRPTTSWSHNRPPGSHQNLTSRQENTGINIDKEYKEYQIKLISKGIPKELLDEYKDEYKKEGNGVQGALQGFYTADNKTKSKLQFVRNKLRNIVLLKLKEPELPSNNILEACRKKCHIIHQLTRFLALDAATQLKNNPTIGHQTTIQQVEPAIKNLITYHQDYPDSVHTLLELEKKAEAYSCKEKLDDILKKLYQSLQNVNENLSAPDNIIWPDMEGIINSVLNKKTLETLDTLGKKWKLNANSHYIENLKSVIREFDNFVETALSSLNPTVTPQSDSSHNSTYLPASAEHLMIVENGSSNMTPGTPVSPYTPNSIWSPRYTDIIVSGTTPAPPALYYTPDSIW